MGGSDVTFALAGRRRVLLLGQSHRARRLPHQHRRLLEVGRRGRVVAAPRGGRLARRRRPLRRAGRRRAVAADQQRVAGARGARRPPTQAATHAAQTRKAVAELGRHQVVENRVDGRVEVDHDAAEIKQVVVALNAQRHHRLRRNDDDPQGQRPERQQTQEEG